MAAEYLGTTQIVTVQTSNGQFKARVPSAHRKVAVGELVGLGFVTDTLSLFDAGSGRAMRTARNEGVLHG